MKLLPVLLAFAFLVFGNPVSAQDWAKEQVDKSQRHLEYVDVRQGDRTVKCFVAYPESKQQTAAVVVVHEIFGLSDWIRKVCDEFASQGYIAIAPDLLSGKNGEETAKLATVDDIRKAVSALPREQVASDLKAVYNYVSKLPAANGKVAIAGFCWGGSQTWLAMTTNPDLKVGFVFYGAAGQSIADFGKIKAPVYGYYGEHDARVSSTVDETKKKMKADNKQYTATIFPNAGHGFMRTGEQPFAEAPNIEARKQGWASMAKALTEM